MPMTCARCKVAPTCPSRGSSPLTPPGSRKPVFCNLIGGYGRDPVDPERLSEAARARAAADGPCLTIAEVPALDEATKYVYRKTVTVYHHPVRHERETAGFTANMLFPKSHRDG